MTLRENVRVGWRAALSVAILFCAAVVSPARAEVVNLFVLAGQSNMEGKGNAADLPAAMQAPREDVRFACRIIRGERQVAGKWGEGWTALQVGTGAAPHAVGFGPEIGFGNAMADAAKPGERVAIVKFARSGANLFEMFHPEAKEGLKLYPKMIAFVREQIQSLRKGGDDVRVAGFIWYQGEADAAASDAQAKAYGDNLKLLIASVRRDLDRPDLPVVAVRVNPHAERHVHADVVRAAIEHVTEADGHAAWVNIDDLNLPDHLHLDAAGQVEAGKRLAAAWAKVAAEH